MHTRTHAYRQGNSRRTITTREAVVIQASRATTTGTGVAAWHNNQQGNNFEPSKTVEGDSAARTIISYDNRTNGHDHVSYVQASDLFDYEVPGIRKPVFLGAPRLLLALIYYF